MKNKSSERLLFCGFGPLPFLLLVLTCFFYLTPLSNAADYSYYFLIDASGSMDDPLSGWPKKKMAEVKEQLTGVCGSLPDGSEVRLFTFSSSTPKEVARFTMDQKVRETVASRIEGIAVDPNGCTYLWRSLEQVLSIAKNEVEQKPGLVIKLTVFADGNDSETNPPNPREYLKNYQHQIQAKSLRPVIVTIGTGDELKAKITKMLEGTGVEIHAGAKPEDLIPLEPSFGFFPEKPQVGQKIALIDNTYGYVVERRWVINGNLYKKTDQRDDRTEEVEFDNAGSVVVQLQVDDSFGRTSTSEKTFTVFPLTPLVPKFHLISDKEEMQVGRKIVFINESTGPFTRYEWNFGDGSIPVTKVPHPAKSYDKPGTYKVTLTLFGETGNSESFSLEIRVLPPKAPTSDFFGPDSIEAGKKISLYSRCSGVVSSWQWLLDDRPVSSEQDVRELQINDSGVHNITLRVVGPGGVNVKTKKIEVVAPLPPKAVIVVPGNDIFAGKEVSFVSHSTNALEEKWVIETGEEEAKSKTIQKNSPSVITHNFPKGGEYTIQLTVSGPGGNDTATKKVIVLEPDVPPDANFVVKSQKTVKRGEDIVVLNNLSSGTISQYTWDFGDGTPVVKMDKREDVTHTFTSGGHYVVSLTAEGKATLPVSVIRKDITVKRAWHQWEKITALAVPVFLLLILLIILLLKWRNRRTQYALSGQLHWRLAGSSPNSWKYHFFVGKKPMEKVLLDETGYELTIEKEFYDEQPRYRLELNQINADDPDDSHYIGEGTIDEDEYGNKEEITIGNFIFHYEL